MFNLAIHELRRLFLSPLAWVMLALSQLILAYLFLTQVDYFNMIQSRISALPDAPGITEMIAIPVLSNAAIIILLITPLLTMRVFAEERRNETLPLLISAPLSISEIVLGKYLGYLCFFFLIALITLLMPLSLTIGSNLDFYLLASALLGLLLLIASFTAIGVFMSVVTRQPVIAAVSTFTLLFMLFIIDLAANNSSEPTIIGWLSLLNHLDPMMEGKINTQDIAYYLIIIVAFLLMTIRRLDQERIA